MIHIYDLEKMFSILLTLHITLQLIFIPFLHTVFQNFQYWNLDSLKLIDETDEIDEN